MRSRSTFINPELYEAIVNELKTKVCKVLSNSFSFSGYDNDMMLLLSEMGLTINNYFGICVDFLPRKIKTKEEISLLVGYLFLMKKFLELLEENNLSNINDLLYTVALCLDYEKVDENRIVMRYADKGKRAYIILNGEVDILIKNPKRMNITLKDYLKYISILIKYEEYGLLNTVVNENFMIYPMEIIDDISINRTETLKGKKFSIKR